MHFHVSWYGHHTIAGHISVLLIPITHSQSGGHCNAKGWSNKNAILGNINTELLG
jgi:hypothetical protein